MENLEPPALDPGSVARSHARLQVALANLVDARAGTIPPTWAATGAMRPHQVHLVHDPKAHVYAIAVTTNRAGQARIHRQGVLHPEQAARHGGRILRSRTVANRWEAWTIKHRTLQAYADRRCITPRAFIEHGRTDTLHEDGPTPRFRSAPT